MTDNSPITIGYSAFGGFDEAYQYHENACYIADTPESLRGFLTDAAFSVNDYETVMVNISDMLNNFGLSNGEYAMEPKALSRFQEVADTLDLDYRVTPDDTLTDEKPDLFIVNLKILNTETIESERLQDIMEDLSLYEGFYKRKSVDAALALKNEITPLLIDVLDEIVRFPEEYHDKNNYHAPVYAVMLLGHFREPKAHKAIIELFSLHEDLLDDLFGDLVFDELPTILLRTCGGSFDQIKSLALDRSAWTHSRYAALKSMVPAVMDGILDRDETLAFFASLFTGKEADHQSDFWSLLATCVYDLYPENMMEIIEKAYDDGLIDPDMISLHNFKSAFEEEEKEPFLEKRRSKEQQRSMDDVHGCMSWWACFDQQNAAPKSNSSPKPEPKPRKAKSGNKKKKSRKKMKKTSKKKNRK